MPVRCEILHDLQIIATTVNGVMWSGEMKAAFEKVRVRPDYDPTWGSLVDLSDADMSEMSPERLREDSQYVSTVRRDALHKRGMVLGEKDYNAGSCRLVEAYFLSLGMNQVTKVFTDREKCIAWLTAPWTDDEKRQATGRG